MGFVAHLGARIASLGVGRVAATASFGYLRRSLTSRAGLIARASLQAASRRKSSTERYVSSHLPSRSGASGTKKRSRSMVESYLRKYESRE